MQVPRPAALLPAKKTRLALNVKLDGPPEPSGRFEEDKICPRTGIRSSDLPSRALVTVQTELVVIFHFQHSVCG